MTDADLLADLRRAAEVCDPVPPTLVEEVMALLGAARAGEERQSDA